MNRDHVLHSARVLWPYAGLWALLAATIVGFSAVQIRLDRNAELDAATAQVEQVARIGATHLGQRISDLDRVLAVVKAVHERRPIRESHAAVVDALRDPEGAMAGARLELVDRQGERVGAGDAPGSRFAATPAFARAREGAAGTQVGDPTGAEDGWVLPLLRRLDGTGGEFDGAIVATIELRSILRPLESAGRVRKVVGLADRRGRVLAPGAGHTRAPAPTIPVARPDSGADGTTGLSALGDEPSLVATRTIPGTPLYAFAAASLTDVYASHRRFTRNTLMLATISLATISLAVLLVGRRALREVGRRRQLEQRFEEVRNRVRTDPLTGIPNRIAFDEHLRIAHAALAADGRPFVLAFIDIDHFKALNDRLGHAVGDRALRLVGHTLQQAVRRADVVSRLGGDEFAVLMPGGNALAMRRVFEPLHAALDQKVRAEGWPISFSVGVVAFETAPGLPREAVNLADRLMYDAKEGGRNAARYAVFRGGALRPEDEPALAA